VEPRPALVPFANIEARNTSRHPGFIPLGYLLGATSRGREACFPWRLLLFIVDVSAGLEMLQLVFAERTTAINDLIFNTLGGGIRLALRPRIPIIKRLRL
jgi:glycopeptide antibiotics resistance protein